MRSVAVRKLRGERSARLENWAEEQCLKNFNRKIEEDDIWITQI
jgi:hypothetical protein